MADSLVTVKKFHLSDGDHLLSASYIIDHTDNSEWTLEQIKELVSQATDLVVDPLGTGQLPTADVSAYSTYYHDIVLIPDPDASSNYIQYVIQRTGTDPNYTYNWVEIGTTQADLSNYVQKGTYTTNVPNTTITGESGATTVTTSSDGGQLIAATATVTLDIPTSMTEDGAQTASGTATVTYKKSNDSTQETGSNSTTANTSENGSHTIQGSNFNFNGTKATITMEASTATINIDKHTYTPQGTLSGSVTIPSHSHTVNEVEGTALDTLTFTANSLPTRASFDYVSGVKTSGGTADAITELTTSSDSLVTSITFSQTPVFNGATVDANGVLSFTTISVTNDTSIGEVKTITYVTGAKTTKTVILNTGLTTSSAYQITGVGTSATLTTGSKTVLIPGTTLSVESAKTINGSDFTFNGTTATLSHTQVGTTTTTRDILNANVPTLSVDYTPSGTIGGSQTVSNHSHTYIELKAHTHGITLTDTTITGTAQVSVASHSHTLINTTTTVTGDVDVDISSHTHTVTIGNHTHTLNNHTHDITFN